MSAYLIETHLLDFVFTVANRARHATVWVPSLNRRFSVDLERNGLTEARSVDVLGAILLRENIRSLTARYGNRAGELIGDFEPDSYRFKEHPLANDFRGEAALVQAFKALECFDYQACESGDYDQTDAARIVQDLRKIFINMLPGYDAAEWGAPEHPPRRGDAPGGPVSLMSIMHGRA